MQNGCMKPPVRRGESAQARLNIETPLRVPAGCEAVHVRSLSQPTPVKAALQSPSYRCVWLSLRLAFKRAWRDPNGPKAAATAAGESLRRPRLSFNGKVLKSPECGNDLKAQQADLLLSCNLDTRLRLWSEAVSRGSKKGGQVR